MNGSLSGGHHEPLPVPGWVSVPKQNARAGSFHHSGRGGGFTPGWRGPGVTMNMVQLSAQNMDAGQLPAEFHQWFPIVDALLKVTGAAVTCWYNPRSGYVEVLNHDLVVVECSSAIELHCFYAGVVIQIQNSGAVVDLLPLSVRKH